MQFHMSQNELEHLSERFETVSPELILEWTVEQFGDQVVASSSFQQNSLVLLHIISRVCPDLPILFIDTGFHFNETLVFKDNLVRQLGLNVREIHSSMSWMDFVETHGIDLCNRDPDLCCQMNKVVPMQRALEGYDAWITGVRRDQSPTRAKTPIVSMQGGLYKVAPLANWTRSSVEDYIRNNDLPSHPLYERGYSSIGCWPCTRPVGPNGNERNGRWSGTGKLECGLHSVYYHEPDADP